MQGRRLQETGGVFSAIRRGFLGAENDADAGRSFAVVGRHYSDRLPSSIPRSANPQDRPSPEPGAGKPERLAGSEKLWWRARPMRQARRGENPIRLRRAFLSDSRAAGAGGLFQRPARIISCLLREEESEDFSVTEQWREPSTSRLGVDSCDFLTSMILVRIVASLVKGEFG